MVNKRKIVKASAGTGKTYRLALEYISRILLGEDYKEILFMTFTRAATAELKVRIFEFLDDLGNGDKELEENIKKLYPEIEFDIEKIKSIKKELLQNKDKIRIYTIDSFIAQIFKKAIGPYLNIYSYTMANNIEEEEIYGEVFSKIVDGPEFIKIKEFLEKTADRDVDKYVKLIKKLSQERWKFSLIKEKTIPENTDLLEDLLYRSVVRIYEYIEELVENHGKDYKKVLAKVGKLLDKEFGNNFDNKEKLINYLLENSKEVLDGKIINGNQMAGKDRAHIKADVLEIQEEIHSSIKKINFIKEVLPYEKDLIEIEKIVRKIYDEIKLREKKFTFSDITNYTSEYLEKLDLGLVVNKSVTENFYEIIGGKITTLFLDEAQDTSVSQWRIIEVIAKNCEAIVVVGDEKQSIYSWRGGNKGLFLSMGKILGASTESLPMNFRSEQKIIDFVNTFFTSISQNQEVKKEEDRWEYKEVKCCKKEDGGFVAVMVDPEIHMAIAIDIEERFSGREKNIPSNYRGIGVVARKKADLNQVGEELKIRKIPFIMDNSLSIVEHLCIKEMLNLFRYFIHNDYMSLVEFFRKTIGVGEKGLKYILRNREQIEKYMNIENSNLEETKELEWNKNIKEELEIIKKIRGLNLKSLGKVILKEYNLLEKYSAPRDIKNINFFLELMDNYEYLNEFIDYLEANRDNLKQVGVTELNSVILMTIHGSKGLDFHTEYMFIKDKQKSYQLTGYDNGMMKQQVQLLTKLDEKYEYVEDYLFTNSIYTHLIKDSEIYNHNEQIYLDEMLNTFYVGMTRPRANLIVSIEPTKSSKTDKITKEKEIIYKLNNDLLIRPIEKFFDVTKEELLGGGIQTVGKFIPYVEKEKTLEDEKYSVSPKIYKDAVSLKEAIQENREEEKEKKEITPNVENELKRKVGLAIHYFLENIEYGTKEEVKVAKQLMLNKYSNMLGIEKTNKVLEKVEEFMKNNNEIFDSRWTVFRELEIKDDDGVHIIDRLNLDEDNKEIKIYDYKSGVSMDQSQLDRYKRVVENKIGGNYKIKTKFLKIY